MRPSGPLSNQRPFTKPKAGALGASIAFACVLGLGCAADPPASTGGTGGAVAGGGGGGGNGGGGRGGAPGSGGAIGGSGAIGSGGNIGNGNSGGSSGATGGTGVPGTGGTTDRDAAVGQDAPVDARAHAGVWRIMPLGDSITGTSCPPQLLSKQLRDNGHTNFIFVGSNLNNQACNGAPNVQSEGHGGYLVTDLVGSGIHAAELPRWCSTDMADVVLMMFGTNDTWSNKPTQTILDAYSGVLTALRAVNPAVILFVAQITPLNPAGCTTCETNVQNLNAQIPGWASSHSTADSPVFVVDVHSAFTASAYTPGSAYTLDGVHPNPAASALIADKWYAALLSQGLP